MDKKFLIWKNPWQAVIWTVGILMGIGCINSFSAIYDYSYLFKYGIFALFSIGLTYFAFRRGHELYLDERFIIAANILIIVALALVALTGTEVKGARRWIYLGPFSLQPSEFAKLIVVIYGAKFLGPFLDRNRKLHLNRLSYWLPLALAALYAGIIFTQPDMGTAAIVLGLAAVTYVLAGLGMVEIVIAGIFSCSGLILMASLSTYRMNRIRIWLDPWLDRLGDGYQAVQSFVAIGSGGLLGTSWGQGASKLYLPEAHTDFAFAIYCQENGFVGLIFLLAVLLVLSSALYRIAVNTKNGTDFLLVSGISFLLVGQSIANMAMVCGIFPVIGVPFPFVSYGGSSLLASILGLGFVYAIFKASSTPVEEEEPQLPRKRRELHLLRRRWQDK